MRSIGLVTTSRADWGIYRPLARAIDLDAELDLNLIVSGMHLSPEFGLTVEQIEAEGFEVAERVECLLSSDSPQGTAKSMGIGVVGFAQALERLRPDILLVLGDRFEMFAAALAAVPFNLPIAHVHGGELTLGAIDDSLRHALTKFSHLHFVSTEEYGRRVMQMGEEPWRVVVCGAPSLDNLAQMELWGKNELKEDIGLALEPPPLLVTFHPATRELSGAGEQVDELLEALAEIVRPVIFTMPNADAGSRAVAERVSAFTQKHHFAHIRDNLGSRKYFSLMASAAAMVGNSSSGILEAASFKLPVVNVGSRQQGRIRPQNVIDVPCQQGQILEGIGLALDPDFRAGLEGLQNPYYQGGAAAIIADHLKKIALDQNMTAKSFHDLGEANW
ncbi:MAG: UDP-N-acetylglucosamine 2-epimerase [Desulfarculaceae bacterium]|jgi:UDP-hydrolysing UDP-N-acetyl-D-glucosamine 2-epimerase